MGRWWSSGFEQNSNTAGIEWDTVGGAAGSVQSTTVRSGTCAGKILTPATGTRSGWLKQVTSATALGIGYYRFYLQVVARPNVKTTIASSWFGTTFNSATGGDYLAVELNTDGTLILVYWEDDVRTTVVATSAALTNGQWYRVEFKVNSSVNGSGWELQLDGSSVGTAASVAIANLNGIRIGANLQAETCTSGEWYFDDIAVNDETGTAQNSWPGEGSIVHVKPNATGDFAEGALGGSVPAATGWESVDEVLPNDGVDFWELQTDSSASSGNADRLDVNCEAMPAAASVTVVAVGIRAKPASNATCSFALRIKSQASGTVIEGGATSITGTSWFTHDDTAGSRQYRITRYTDPQTGGAWTEALVNSMQIGVRAPDGNPNVQVSTLWALVEYVPAVGGATAVPVFMNQYRQRWK